MQLLGLILFGRLDENFCSQLWSERCWRKVGSRLIALRNDNDGSIHICSGGSRREGLLHSTAYSGTIVNQRLTITNGLLNQSGTNGGQLRSEEELRAAAVVDVLRVLHLPYVGWHGNTGSNITAAMPGNARWRYARHSGHDDGSRQKEAERNTGRIPFC